MEVLACFRPGFCFASVGIFSGNPWDDDIPCKAQQRDPDIRPVWNAIKDERRRLAAETSAFRAAAHYLLLQWDQLGICNNKVLSRTLYPQIA